MAKYRLYDRPTDGTTGQDCGVFALDKLPQRIRTAIASDPDASDWTLPALSGGDDGEPLDDLDIVITLCN